MQTLASNLRVLQQGVWMLSLDLKDPIFTFQFILHTGSFWDSRLGIGEDSSTFTFFLFLPFGLATTPRVFTKLLAPIVGHLYLSNMCTYPYMDDIFHAQISKDLVIAT